MAEHQALMLDDPELRRLLWFLLGRTRGGENRARISHELLMRPSNLNQLSTKLSLDYRAIHHHVEVLKKNRLVTPDGKKYAQEYFLNQWLEAHIHLFEEICERLKFKFEDGVPKESAMELVQDHAVH
jgi:DNA-binding transcriptional ArsR family regulator